MIESPRSRSASARAIVSVRSDTIIGRGRGCELVIPLESVSRRHCELRLTSSGPVVRDLGSHNGTYVNGDLLPAGEDRLLSTGDELSVGPIRMRVRVRGEHSPTRSGILRRLLGGKPSLELIEIPRANAARSDSIFPAVATA